MSPDACGDDRWQEEKKNYNELIEGRILEILVATTCKAGVSISASFHPETPAA
jgi:hypothetical protein